MKKIIAIFTMLTLNQAWCESSKADLLWKARGLQAIERIAAIQRSFKDKGFAQEKICEIKLEEAYSVFTSPEIEKFKKKMNKHAENFRLFFVDNTKKETESLTMISFMYSKGSTVMGAANILSVADEWAVGVHIESQTIIVNGNDCTFTFPLRDPLNGKSAIRPN